MMGMNVGDGRGGVFVEMNVVPLIDILLVLLVIFMIIPHQEKGLDALLPRLQRSPTELRRPRPSSWFRCCRAASFVLTRIRSTGTSWGIAWMQFSNSEPPRLHSFAGKLR